MYRILTSLIILVLRVEILVLIILKWIGLISFNLCSQICSFSNSLLLSLIIICLWISNRILMLSLIWDRMLHLIIINNITIIFILMLMHLLVTLIIDWKIYKIIRDFSNLHKGFSNHQIKDFNSLLKGFSSLHKCFSSHQIKDFNNLHWECNNHLRITNRLINIIILILLYNSQNLRIYSH